MITDGLKGSSRLAYWIIVFLFFFAGCRLANSEKLQEVPPIKNRTPTTPRVESALSSLLTLETDTDRRRALMVAHQDWLKLRESHCISEAMPDKEDESRTRLWNCYEAFDRKYVETLNQQRLAFLLNAQPRGVLPDQTVRVPYSEEATAHPSGPRIVAVASIAPVASVTHKDGTTESFDLVNGHLLSRIPTFDPKTLSGIYELFLTPNGRILIASSHWPRKGLKMWDVQTGEMLRESTATQYYRALTSQGRHFIFTEYNNIGIYDIQQNEITWSFLGKESTYNMALSPDDKWLVIVFEKRMEIWGLVRTDDKRLSYAKHSTVALGDARNRPSGIAFSGDSQSCYGSLRNGNVIEWQLPDLKFVRGVRFPGFEHVRLLQIPKSNILLMDATKKNNTREAFWVDMRKETAHRFEEYSGSHSRIAPLGNDQVLLATSYELKTSKQPHSSAFLPFSHVFPGLVAEAVLPFSTGAQPPQDKETTKANCQDFKVEAIGVYEGTLPHGQSRGFQEVKPGYVEVSVGRTDKPTKLLLCSYEPVVWRLQVSPDASLAEVFLSGSNESRIEGLSGTVVTFLGNVYAYRSEKMTKLADLVRQRTGCEIARFQGSYTGARFSIGYATSQGSGDRIYRHVGKGGEIIYRNYPQ